MTGPEAKPSHIQEAESWALTAFERRGPKLTFSEKCGIAYALKERMVTTEVVREAFALSASTVSWLRHCLQPGDRHYRDVWAEWQALGPEAFAEKHYTRDLHFRFRRIRDNLVDENDIDRIRKLAGANPKANKYCGLHTLPNGEQWEITLLTEHNPPGYAFRIVGGVWHGKERLRGLSEWDPFASSEKAYDAMYEINSFDNPRKEGK